MHITQLAKLAWQDAGLYDSNNSKIQAFLAHVDAYPDVAWTDLIVTLREEHADVFKEFTEPLLHSPDKLLRLAVIRNADPKKRRELNLLKAFIEQASPRDDEPELLAIADLKHKSLLTALRQRNDLTGELRRRVGGYPG